MSPDDALPIRSRPLGGIESPGVDERRRERAGASGVAAARAELSWAVADRDDARRRRDTLRRRWGWLPLARARVERADEALLNREMEAVGAADRVDAAVAESRLVQVPTDLPSWVRLERDFGTLGRSDRLWDATHHPPRPPADVDPDLHRHWPHQYERRPVVLSRRALPEYGGSVEALWFQNANGPALFLFPDLLVLRDEGGATAPVDLREVEATTYRAKVFEPGEPPPDADGTGWGGSPKYGVLHLRSGGGLNEAYLVSDPQKAKQFVYALETHQKAVRQWYADRGL